MLQMMPKLIVSLFWPWVNATVCAAYNEFQFSQKYNWYISQGDLFGANQYFHDVAIEHYMETAFIKHWKRILFCPWTIICSNERHYR